ncbi:hypothetical protein ACOSP7_021059 [Xanthoceras sorbifolium]
MVLDQYNINKKVGDFLIGNSWDKRLLRVLMLEEIVKCICSIYAGHYGSGEDKVIWGSSKDEEFSVSTAYDSIVDRKDNADLKWRHIWKLKIPPKLKFFLWLLLHGKILTN